VTLEAECDCGAIYPVTRGELLEGSNWMQCPACAERERPPDPPAAEAPAAETPE
jgi:hypothetical protein